MFLNSSFSSDYCLNFIFKGKFTTQVSKEATDGWKEAFAYAPQNSFVLVWDCTEMNGFEMDARKDWIACMNQLHGQIEKVIVISDHMAIRGAAHLMLSAFQFEYKVFKSYLQTS